MDEWGCGLLSKKPQSRFSPKVRTNERAEATGLFLHFLHFVPKCEVSSPILAFGDADQKAKSESCLAAFRGSRQYQMRCCSLSQR